MYLYHKQPDTVSQGTITLIYIYTWIQFTYKFFSRGARNSANLLNSAYCIVTQLHT